MSPVFPLKRQCPSLIFAANQPTSAGRERARESAGVGSESLSYRRGRDDFAGERTVFPCAKKALRKSDASLIIDTSRPTTIKTRIIAQTRWLCAPIANTGHLLTARQKN